MEESSSSGIGGIGIRSCMHGFDDDDDGRASLASGRSKRGGLLDSYGSWETGLFLSLSHFSFKRFPL